MGKIKVTDREGKLHELEADVGSTIMEIIRDAGLDIEAACGGCCACATCHVYINNNKNAELNQLRNQAGNKILNHINEILTNYSKNESISLN